MKKATAALVASAGVGALIADAVLVDFANKPLAEVLQGIDGAAVLRKGAKLAELNGLSSSFVQSDSNDDTFVSFNEMLFTSLFGGLNRVNNSTTADGVLFPNKFIDTKLWSFDGTTSYSIIDVLNYFGSQVNITQTTPIVGSSEVDLTISWRQNYSHK